MQVKLHVVCDKPHHSKEEKRSYFSVSYKGVGVLGVVSIVRWAQKVLIVLF